MRPKDILNMLNTNTATLIHIIIKLSEVKDKERILQAARGNREAVNERTSHNRNSSETFRPREDVMAYSKCRHTLEKLGVLFQITAIK